MFNFPTGPLYLQTDHDPRDQPETGDWIRTNWIGAKYQLLGKDQYHTGEDLVRKSAPCKGKPVIAVMAGTVTFSGDFTTQTWRDTIVIAHVLPDGTHVSSRYAHLDSRLVTTGQVVQAGQQIGTVGDAHGVLPAHLHFDIAFGDVLQRKPDHWPGTDLAAVRANYCDPLAFLLWHEAVPIVVPDQPPVERLVVTTTIRLNVRSAPGGPVVGSLQPGAKVLATDTVSISGQVWRHIIDPLQGWSVQKTAQGEVWLKPVTTMPLGYDMYRKTNADMAAITRTGEFVMHKISEGTYGNWPEPYNTRKAVVRAAGDEYGAYHFSTNANAQQQIDNLLRGAPPDGLTIYSLDAERNPDENEPGSEGTVRLSTLASMASYFKQRTGKWPGIYSTASFLNSQNDPAALAVLGQCWLWIASQSDTPVIPPPWSKADLQQFGMTDGIDTDRFLGENLHDWWLANAPAPLTPTPATQGVWGVNIDVKNGPLPQELGCQWVRFVFNPARLGLTTEQAFQLYDPFIERYTAANIRICLVMAEKSVNDLPSICLQVARRYTGKIAAYEIWNEEDQASESAVGLAPLIYKTLLKKCSEAIKATDANAQVVIGGLVSSNPLAYLAQSGVEGADDIGVHPYTKDPHQLVDFLKVIHAAYPNLGLYVTEYGWPGHSDSETSMYMRATFSGASDLPYVKALLWFCWSDAMVNGFGVVNADGTPKPLTYAAFKANGGTVTIPPSTDMLTQGWGAYCFRNTYQDKFADRPILKSQDDVSALERAHQRNPKQFHLYRYYLGDNSIANWVLRYGGVVPAAEAWWSLVKGDLLRLPWAYHEGFNEQPLNDVTVAFESARVDILTREGLKACVINTPWGNPLFTDWAKPNVVALLRKTAASGGCLGLHAYAGGIISANNDKYYWTQQGRWSVPGQPFPATVDPEQCFTTCRVIKDRQLIEAQGVSIQIVFTEEGCDKCFGPGLYPPYGVETDGWLSCEDAWRKEGWLATQSPASFYRQGLDWLTGITKTPGVVYAEGDTGNFNTATLWETM